jgi:hypothetical protein
VGLYPTHGVRSRTWEKARVVAAIELENLEDYAGECILKVVHDCHQLFRVSPFLQNRKVTMVCDVAPDFTQEPFPAAFAVPVVRLEDVGVGEPKGSN